MIGVKFDASKVDMSEYALREASGLLKTIAGSRRADESVKAVLHRLSRDLKDWSYGNIRAVWYRDHRVKIRAGEIEQLRAIASRALKTRLPLMNFRNYEAEFPDSKRSWRAVTRRFIARRFLRFGASGARWAEKAALWIDPTITGETP